MASLRPMVVSSLRTGLRSWTPIRSGLGIHNSITSSSTSSFTRSSPMIASLRSLSSSSSFSTLPGANRTSAILGSLRRPRWGSRFNSSSSSAQIPVLTAPSVAKWLYAASGLVFFIIVVGGVTRLTESGLSITEWEPFTGIIPPISDAEWQVEWEKYRVTPEGVLMNSQLDIAAFKRIFYMEWAHRVAGRVLGVGFVLPALYFIARGKVGTKVKWKLGALALGIGFQGALGWYMVKSGLDDEILATPGAVPRVSQYRLAAHLGAALLLYVGMIHTAIGISRDWKFATGKKLSGIQTGTQQEGQVFESLIRGATARRFGRFATLIGTMVLVTAVSGAFVAGLDAGLIYNEFPTMGGQLIPPTDELMDSRYAQATDKSDKWWRNMLENPTTVQFDHRALAITTFLSILSLPFIATRPGVRKHLPRAAIPAAKGAMHAAILQVTLGISTLLYLVPVPLAAAHQAGSVVLLTAMLVLAGTFRRPTKAAYAWRQLNLLKNAPTVKAVDSSLKARVNMP